MSEVLKCLSIRQPWAHLILHGGKDVENRTWRTDYRGPLVIHASKAWAKGVPQCMTVGGHEFVVPRGTAPRGALVGIVDLVDVAEGADSPWAEPDCCHWLLENPRPLPAPIPWKGALSLWEIARNELAFRCVQNFEEAATKMLLEVMGT